MPDEQTRGPARARACRKRWRCAVALAVAFASAVVPSLTTAQPFPVRPLRLVVGFAPGGANDIVGRTLAHKLTEVVGQQVVVDNRAGANGVVANATVAKATPDGYTLLLVPASFSYDTALQSNLPYNPKTDFAPISLVATAPFIFLANPSFPASNMTELVKAAKASPGQLTYATGGVGNLTHLAGELFNSMAGIRLVAVPYRGTGPGLVDLMAGQVPLQVAAILSTVPHVKSGKVRALAVTSAKRSQILNSVPTVAESGFPGFDASGWWAILAPRGMSRETLAALNRSIDTALVSAEVREQLLRYGAEAAPTTPQQIAEHIDKQSAIWTRVIRNAQIQMK